MGQLVHNISLTQPGIAGPNGQFENASQAQNTIPSMPTDDLNAKSAPSTMQKPSYQQAVKMGAGPVGENALSPGLTKAGKLVTLLTSGLQGALAGRAAQEQTIAESGGRRAGGVGTGFQAGYMLPWQRAQQQAQAQLATMGAQPIQTQFGQVPAAYLPHFIAPMLNNATKQNIADENIAARAEQGEANRQNQANIAQLAHRYHTIPGIGLFDTQANGGQGGVVPGSQQGITITPDIARDYNLPAQFVGMPMDLGKFSSLENAQRFNEAVVEGAGGPALVNKNPRSPDFGKTVGLGLGNPSMGRPLQVGDVNNPGETMYMPAYQAISSGAPGTQSASVQVPRTAAKAEVPTKIGDMKVAFNTAIQHANLLRQAYSALNNGDQQTLNSLKNRFQNEFGVAGPVTADAIADAYSREVNKMLSSNHMTDADLRQIGGTLNPRRQSPQQVMGVLNAYQALAQSKMQQLNQQKQSAINQSQPRKAGAQQNDPLGIR